MVNIFFKMFYKQTRIFITGTFYEKIGMKIICLFLDTFCETCLLHSGLLELQFLDYNTVATKLSWGTGGELLHRR